MQAPHGVCELSRMLSPSPYTPPYIPLSLLYIHREKGIVGGGYRGMCIAMVTATGSAAVWPWRPLFVLKRFLLIIFLDIPILFRIFASSFVGSLVGGGRSYI